jgi:hypothetical protein
MWKLLRESVPGVSHDAAGLPCQDYSLGESLQPAGEAVLLLLCSDGAGSAEHAALGARIASEEVARVAREALGDGLRVSDIDAAIMTDWYRRAREALGAEAALRSARLRDFACTLLAAIVGERFAAFSQIGDGAIVFREEDTYQTVFWPQAGEYANTTNFLTNEDFERRLEFCARPVSVDELALLTDGLQMLALRYAERSVHAGFFRPMFQALRTVACASDLQAPLREFLNSPQVNQRTDDDKTLILAVRRLPDDPAQLVRQPEPPD